MDRVLRTYAQSAWTPADPMAGLDPEVRRCILLMPSTFRERWKVAPWTSRHYRRMAIAEIIAERRLQYELTHQTLVKVPDLSQGQPAAQARKPLSPFWQDRLRMHQAVGQELRFARLSQDVADAETIPEFQADPVRVQSLRNALKFIELERARLDVKELELMTGSTPAVGPPTSVPARKVAQIKSKRADRHR